MLQRFRQWQRIRRRQRALRNIRQTFIVLGHDVSQYTDKELEDRLEAFLKAMRLTGFTATEASHSFRRLANAAIDFEITFAQARLL